MKLLSLFPRINTILSDDILFSSFRWLSSFCTLLDGCVGNEGGKDDRSDWLEHLRDEGGV